MPPDMVLVEFHCLLAQVEERGNLFHGPSLAEQLHDVALSFGQFLGELARSGRYQECDPNVTLRSSYFGRLSERMSTGGISFSGLEINNGGQGRSRNC